MNKIYGKEPIKVTKKWKTQNIPIKRFQKLETERENYEAFTKFTIVLNMHFYAQLHGL